MAELVKPNVGKDEVLIMRVALPKILRHTNKLPPSLKYNVIGNKYVNGLKTEKNPNAAYQILGDDGWMIEADYLNKDFGKYGLKEYFDRAGKIAQANALDAENSMLQEAVINKDAQLIEAAELIRKLQAELDAKEKTEDPKEVVEKTEEVKEVVDSSAKTETKKSESKPKTEEKK